jgi:hypothetical protein
MRWTPLCAGHHYALNTTMRWTPLCAGHQYAQINTDNTNMGPHTNNRRQRRIEHRFYAEIVTDTTTRNSERKVL